MDVHFARKQKQFHNNPGINPDNGKKLIYGKGPYLKFVVLYGEPVKTQIIPIQFPLQLLPLDIIDEILRKLDMTTRVSLLLINKYVNGLSTKYKIDIIRNALRRELNYVKEEYKEYFRSLVMDIKVGDRINDSCYNYKVITLKRQHGTLYHVDMLGNKIEDKIYYLEMIRERKRSFWYIKKEQNDQCDYQAEMGIIQYDYGPKIEHYDSHYLKYKTIPDSDNLAAEINALVLVYRKNERGYSDVMEYYISKIVDGILTLKYVSGCNIEYPIKKLKVVKVDDYYYVPEQGYTIKKIGGFIDYDDDY